MTNKMHYKTHSEYMEAQKVNKELRKHKLAIGLLASVILLTLIKKR